MMAVSPLNSSIQNTLTDTLTPQAEARLLAFKPIYALNNTLDASGQLATRATRFERGRNDTLGSTCG